MEHSVILTIGDVCHRTGLSRATIYRYQAKGKFPHSVGRGLSRVGWLEQAVEEFVQKCMGNDTPDNPET